MKHEGWSEVGAAAGVPLDSEQARRLDAFEGLLRDRAIPLGIVSPSDEPRLRERHLVDCLRAAALVGRSDRAAYDLGSGAGLPGVVVATACPWLQVTLVEGRWSRAAFLELAVETLGLGNVRVHAERLEGLRELVDLCFARALADPSGSWRLAEPLLTATGRLVYFAGAGLDPNAQVPPGVHVEIVDPVPLARAGPLVIMSRQ